MSQVTRGHIVLTHRQIILYIISQPFIGKLHLSCIHKIHNSHDLRHNKITTKTGNNRVSGRVLFVNRFKSCLFFCCRGGRKMAMWWHSRVLTSSAMPKSCLPSWTQVRLTQVVGTVHSGAHDTPTHNYMQTCL